jgi:peptidoglycan biosynthesis protein MviN/MurJ (putative lipid II flippase)
VNVIASAVLITVAGYRGFVAANVLALLVAAGAYAGYSWRRYDLRYRPLGRSLGQTAVATTAASGVVLALNQFVWNDGLNRVDTAFALSLSFGVYAVVAFGMLIAARDEVALAFIEVVRRRFQAALLPSPRSRVSP